jgi:hypothetical protein
MSKSSFLVMAAVLFVVLAGDASVAKDVSAVDHDIHDLLDATGTFSTIQQMMQGQVQSIARSQPSIPKRFWDDMLGRYKKEDFYALITPVYRKNMSPNDITGLLAFYRTPLGRRVLASLPKSTQESIAVGQLWGQKVIKDIAAEVKKRGYWEVSNPHRGFG